MLTYQLREADPAVPALTTQWPNTMIAPVIPEDMPLRCSYNGDSKAWHCSYESWFKQPALYTIVMVGVLGFGLGFLIAAFPPVKEAIKTAKSLSPV